MFVFYTKSALSDFSVLLFILVPICIPAKRVPLNTVFFINRHLKGINRTKSLSNKQGRFIAPHRGLTHRKDLCFFFQVLDKMPPPKAHMLGKGTFNGTHCTFSFEKHLENVGRKCWPSHCTIIAIYKFYGSNSRKYSKRGYRRQIP